MKKLYIVLSILLITSSNIYAFTWDECIQRYEKARQFSDNVRLSYLYLKSTKTCLIKFKKILEKNPNPEFTVKAMNDNILMLSENIDKLLPSYKYPKNNLETVPKYLYTNSNTPILNKEYKYFKKFKECNGVHANNKIYTAKHCNINNSKNIKHDLNYLEASHKSELQVSKLNLNKKGTFKYYSMSKLGMFYESLLKERNCSFYKFQNKAEGQNTSLDLADLSKKTEIRSNCLAIPSNSGGGVFQDGKLVGIISKTVFDKNRFLYSVIEPILPSF